TSPHASRRKPPLDPPRHERRHHRHNRPGRAHRISGRTVSVARRRCDVPKSELNHALHSLRRHLRVDLPSRPTRSDLRSFAFIRRLQTVLTVSHHPATQVGRPHTAALQPRSPPATSTLRHQGRLPFSSRPANLSSCPPTPSSAHPANLRVLSRQSEAL